MQARKTGRHYVANDSNSTDSDNHNSSNRILPDGGDVEVEVEQITDGDLDAEFAALSGFQRDVLFAIAGYTGGHDGPKGLWIKDEVQSYHSSNINHGRLYPNLDTLVELGLIEKGKRDRRTNEYQLTPLGEAQLRRRHSQTSDWLGGDRR